MTAEQFTYWLQGYSEIAGAAPNADQWQVIQDHLQLVFQKATPFREYQPNAPHFPLTAVSSPHRGAQTLC